MNNEFNSKQTNQALDLAGLNERIQKRERILKEQQQAQQEVNAAAEAYQQALKRVRKAEQPQAPQQLDASSGEARERGFRSAFAGGHRRIDLRKLQEADPAAFAFLVRNTSVETA